MTGARGQQTVWAAEMHTIKNNIRDGTLPTTSLVLACIQPQPILVALQSNVRCHCQGRVMHHSLVTLLPLLIVLQVRVHLVDATKTLIHAFIVTTEAILPSIRQRVEVRQQGGGWLGRWCQWCGPTMMLCWRW